MSCFGEVKTIGKLMKLRNDLIEAIKNDRLIPWSEMTSGLLPIEEEYGKIITYVDSPDSKYYEEGKIICDYLVDGTGHHDIVATYDSEFPELRIRLVRWFDGCWKYDVSIEEAGTTLGEKIFFSELFDNRWVFNKEN